MIKIIPAADRHFTDYGWLQTYWLFSFSDYYDPGNMHFGSLRVFNDDVVEARSGFPTHPHKEMEIITIVLSGELTHKDNTGTEAVIRAGEVQRMSAGTGIMHSEYNMGDEPLSLYQIWILPDIVGLKPSYDQKEYDPSTWKNKLAPVASGQGFDNVVQFNTDATIYRSELDKDNELEFSSENGRKIFIYLSHGRLSVNGNTIGPGDQARISHESNLNIRALEDADFVMIDVGE